MRNIRGEVIQTERLTDALEKSQYRELLPTDLWYSSAVAFGQTAPCAWVQAHAIGFGQTKNAAETDAKRNGLKRLREHA